MNYKQDSLEILEVSLNEQLASGSPGVILEINAPKLGFTYSNAVGVFAFAVFVYQAFRNKQIERDIVVQPEAA